MEILKRITVILLIVTMLFSTSVFSVYAVDSMSEIVLERGTYANNVCVYSTYNTISFVEFLSGYLPEGINFYFTENGLYIAGTPTGEGSYYLQFNIEEQTSSGTVYNTHTLHITISSQQPVEAKTTTVTKSPTSETVTEGGGAMFISAAENYSYAEWRFVSPDGATVSSSSIRVYFPGLVVNSYMGDDSREYLVLNNIPLEMNGYYIQTLFVPQSGGASVTTAEKSCLLTVKAKKISAPVISSQPQDVDAELGTAVTLEVVASSFEGNIKYQWYITRNGTVEGGARIEGATASRFVPPQTEGSKMYFCVMYTVNGDNISESGTTRIATVKYTKSETVVTPAVTTTPAPTAAVTTQPAVVTPEPVPVTVQKTDHTVAYITGAVLICAMVCGTVIYLSLSKPARKKRRY